MPVQLIAHRGRVANRPENAIESLRSALALADGVEIDVRLSGDGVPVLMHDAEVARTTNGSGNVGDLTVAQLAALDLGGGAGVPRLTDYLEVAVPLGCPIVIDVKDPSPACLDALAEVTAPFAGDHLLFAVRADAALQRLRQLAPAARLASLGVTTDNVNARLRCAESNDAEVLFVHHGDAAYERNRTAVATIRQRGLTAAASTLTSQDTIELAAADGCAMALVDLPAITAPKEPA